MAIPVTLPPGFQPVEADAAYAFAVPTAVAWAEGALSGGGTFHGWASAHDGRREMTGRGRVFSVPAPAPATDGASRWVVRHYYRGGLVARYLDDRYLAVGVPRPVQEAGAAGEARDRGIPTPSVVAGAVYPAGLFYRADLVTEEIPDAADLATVLFAEGERPVPAEAALVAAGALVRRLEKAGVFHPDLNAKNIVLRPHGDGAEAHLVDLDKCCPRVVGVPAPAYPMRRRLERSLRKFERRRGRYLPDGAWAALHRGFSSL